MFDEKEILEYWGKNKVFEKSVEQRKPSFAKATKGKQKTFVFFEGPPTANGVPGVHHVEARSFKDIILRFKTMQGFFVPRRAGWDTHGLPVEVQVEKALGLKNKRDIEAYGVAEFNKKSKESVWQYKELWEQMTARMGFWIDMKNPYITYENSYIESLWAIVKEFASKNLLYEDFKVMPWCTRCGTALSSHELAQGYEKVKENSIYVKFPTSDLKIFFLAWTTTPWTLPGNTALAINPEINYCYAKNNQSGEVLILAESRIGVLGEGFSIIKKVPGKELVGKEYVALYPAVSPPLGGETAKLYKIVAGDFVSNEDGSGIVHIAPAFGDDDFQLGKKYDLPVLLTVDERGIMQTPEWTWNGAFFKKADPLIIEDLRSRNLLFKEESYEHDYPFCWRCKTPLMYLAKKSWWVDVNKVRAELLENNSTVDWHPSHIKDGRFGEWLKEKKNWAFSRERYWGTPLPVWRCEKCGKWEAIGSLQELAGRGAASKNKYIMMRHGESVTNMKNITNCTLEKNIYPLTKKGIKEAEKSAKAMKAKKIKFDMIIASPLLRAKETAEITAKIYGINPKDIKFDNRLMEINTGIFAEGNPAKYHKFYKGETEKFEKAPPEGESLNALKKRIFSVLEELEVEYSGKTILIVSHEYPLWMLWSAAEGKNYEESVTKKEGGKIDFLKTGAWDFLNLPAVPRGENFILDMHKPYIDGINLKCGSCTGSMKRVSEVCDVWFDSGAMPYASVHWPFESSEVQPRKNLPRLNLVKFAYPADYIVEAIDQTRGWFYTLSAVAALLGRSTPYKNVLVLGHVLDKNGKKMSKSLGNIVEPMSLIDKYGADAVRWYFFTINQPWDSKLFDENEIKDASRRFFMILWNVLQFWKMYSSVQSDRHLAIRPPSTKLLINKWALTKLAEISASVTEKLEAYDVVGAARGLESFVTEDVSRWYIRRVRDVMKNDPKETTAVIAYLLGEISKLLAPFAPFTAEKIWLELGAKSSVHLEDWAIPNHAFKISLALPRNKSELNSAARAHTSKFSPHDSGLLDSMNEVRRIVVLALEARQKAGIKVRQPLAKLEVKNIKLKTEDKDLLELIKDEVNVKEVVFNAALKDEVSLDTNISPELREEGVLRDLIREIQSARKTAGLTPKNKVAAGLALPKEIFEVAKKNEKQIMKETNLKSISLSESQETKITLK